MKTPTNPVVFGADQLSVVSVPYAKYSLPARIVIRDKVFDDFPEFIYVQNQMFKLHGNNVITNFMTPAIPFAIPVDSKLEIGIVVYKRTTERPVVPEKEDKKVDKEEKK